MALSCNSLQILIFAVILAAGCASRKAPQPGPQAGDTSRQPSAVEINKQPGPAAADDTGKKDNPATEEKPEPDAADKAPGPKIQDTPLVKNIRKAGRLFKQAQEKVISIGKVPPVKDIEKVERAIVLMKQALEILPESADYHYFHAHLLFKLGIYHENQSVYWENRADGQRFLKEAGKWLKLDKPTPAQVKKWDADAKRHLNLAADNFRLALKELDEVDKLRAGYISALSLRANIYIVLQKFGKAQAIYEKLAGDPRLSENRREIAAGMVENIKKYRQNKTEERDVPDAEDSGKELDKIKQAVSFYARAKQTVKEAADSIPAAKQKILDRAIEQLDNSIKLNPDWAEPRYLLAWCLKEKGLYCSSRANRFGRMANGFGFDDITRKWVKEKKEPSSEDGEKWLKEVKLQTALARKFFEHALKELNVVAKLRQNAVDLSCLKLRAEICICLGGAAAAKKIYEKILSSPELTEKDRAAFERIIKAIDKEISK